MNKNYSDLRRRTRKLSRRRLRKDRRFVLCWLQQALRGVDNPVIDAAIATGNEHHLPVLVYHGLDNRYPYASHRFHRFILEASLSLEEAVTKRRLRFCRYVRRDEKLEYRLLYKLAEEAACIFTDDMPTFVARRQAESVAKNTEVPVFAVDAACAVPMNCFPEHLEATKAFRAAHKPLREGAFAAIRELKPTVRKYTAKLCFEHDDISDYSTRKLDGLIKRCGVDMSLKPIGDFPGDRATALMCLEHAILNVVPRYKWTRNNPAMDDSTSKLSPYLHYGVLGPREISDQVNSADLHSAARWKFLDELLTWREYWFHMARHVSKPASYLNCPAWARKSLAEHADDPRPELYSLSELLHGQTSDQLWNAAQRQFLLDGWMHNNLRMYWVKQIHKWLPTPEQAWQVACYLNDRLSLDGRDPATYGGIQWGFGRAKRGYRELPIYGWVPPKSSAALNKRDGVSDWCKWQLARKLSEIPVEKSKKYLRLYK